MNAPDTTSRDKDPTFLTEIVRCLLDALSATTASCVEDDRVLYSPLD